MHAAASTATFARSATAASAPSTSSTSQPQLLGDDDGQWTPDKIQATLDSKKTVQANFVKPLPVYIVYFSSAALLDGPIVDYKDLYGRDSKAMAAMQMKDGGASLAPPKPKPEDQIAGPPPTAKPKPKATGQVATR